VLTLFSLLRGLQYPVEQARYSNMKNRPIGIGIQGLADTFIRMRFPFESADAQRLNKDIFETMYFAALNASKDIAKIDGPYQSYPGSPASKGLLQFDLWSVKPDSGRWDWAALKAEIATHGLRNSLLLAPMPTASTSQILGNNEVSSSTAQKHQAHSHEVSFNSLHLHFSACLCALSASSRTRLTSTCAARLPASLCACRAICWRI